MKCLIKTRNSNSECMLKVKKTESLYKLKSRNA